MDEKTIIQMLLNKMLEEGLWFTTKNDPTYEEASSYYELDQYGDLTDKVEIISGLKNNQVGTYKITYVVKDSAGNTATATRTVIVKEDKKPEEKPTNTIDGGNNTTTNEISNSTENNTTSNSNTM